MKRAILIPMVVLGLALVLRPCVAQEQPASMPATPLPGMGAMSLDRPPAPVIMPQTQPDKTKPASKIASNGLVLERRMTMNLPQGADWLVAHVDAQGDLPEQTFWLLPCAVLEEMEKAFAHDAKAVFQVSGETMDYKDLKFLLVTAATILPTEEALAPVVVPDVQSATEPAEPTSLPSAYSQPASAPADEFSVPQEIMQRMLREKRGKPILTPSVAVVANDAPSLAPGAQTPLASGRRQMLANRTIRVFPDSDGRWMTGRFLSDNTLQEPPMRLLPCPLLQRAETLTEANHKNAQMLKVSGEILTYKGQNYLLLRKVLATRDMNQF